MSLFKPFTIDIYTDGACKGNPGRGGYGYIIYGLTKGKPISGSCGYKRTTNNRMELMAVISALQQIRSKNRFVDLYTDSKYIADSINFRWVNKWAKTDFNGRPNKDLWAVLFNLINEFKYLRFIWVKGHSDNAGNIIADTLACSATDNAINIDHGYTN